MTTRKLKIIVDQEGNARQGISALSTGLGKIGGVATIAATGLAALGGATVAAGAYLVSLGSDAEEMQAKFDVVFGDSALKAAANLDEFGNAVGRNKFELMEMASSVQDTFVPMGFARGEAANLSVQMTELAVDVASFNNTLDTAVMQDFQSAIVGNHETVRKYGIVITEATLNQELMRMGIAEGNKAATEQEKVQARLNLIMQGTTDAQGDAARTSGSFANQMRGLKAEFSEAATTMGVELLPIATDLLKTFNGWIKDILPKAVELFKVFAADLRENAGPALLVIKDALTRMAEAFGINTEEVSATEVILIAFKAVLDAIIIAVKLSAVTMHTLADAVEAGRRQWDAIIVVVREVQHTFSSAMDSIRHGISVVIDKWNELKRAAKDAINAIPEWLRPGSPTPFEIGLRGIARATGEVSDGLANAFAINPQVTASGNSGSVTVNLNYNPTLSTADRYELETILTDIVQSINRKGMR